MRPCYAFNAATTTTPASLSIFDEIGFWGIQAKDFIAQLGATTGKALTVEINSPGGDVFAAVAMYNALRASGKDVTTKVMGVAASAASLVFMAGDKREMPKNTFLMIHNPWNVAMGNAEELRETADVLDKVGTVMRSTYASRSGMSNEDMDPLFAKDTWLTADESVEMGFATDVTDDITASASFDMARADLPTKVAAVFKAAEKPAPVDETGDDAIDAIDEPDEPDEPDDEIPSPLAEQIAEIAKTEGFEAHAGLIAMKALTIEDAKTRCAEMREIKALCAVVKKPAEADALLSAGKTLPEARAHLQTLLAVADEATPTDSTTKNSNQPAASASPSAVTTADIWAKHNKQRQGV